MDDEGFTFAACEGSTLDTMAPVTNVPTAAKKSLRFSILTRRSSSTSCWDGGTELKADDECELFTFATGLNARTAATETRNNPISLTRNHGKV